MADGKGTGATDRMARELAVVGSPSECREQLAEFRSAGIDMPILNPVPVGGQSYLDAVRKAIETFGQ